MRSAHSGRARVAHAAVVTLLVLGLTLPCDLHADRPLVFGLLESQPVTSLDYLDAMAKPRLLVEAQIMEGLLGLDPSDDGKLVPRLAASHHRIDGVTYVFRLRKHLYFHRHAHGPEIKAKEPVTAADVAFSIDRARRSPSAALFRFDNIEFVRAVGPDLIKIKLSKPDEDLPFRLATSLGHVTCEEYYESLGPDERRRKAAFMAAPIGTGPYRLARPLGAEGEPIALERFAFYRNAAWVKSPSAVQRVEFRFFDSPATIVAGLRRGEIDMASLFLSDLGIGGVDAPLPPDFPTVLRLAPPFLTLIAINVKKPELSPAIVRRLFNAAIRREKIGEICPTDEIAAVPSGYEYYFSLTALTARRAAAELQALRAQPEAQQALQRLRARGPLTALVADYEDPIRDRILDSIAADFAQHLDLELVVRRSRQLGADVLAQTPTYDFVYVDWTPDTPRERQAHSILRPLFLDGSRANFAHYSDEQVMKMFESIDGVVDPTTIERLSTRIRDRLLVNPPHLWLTNVRTDTILYGDAYRVRFGSSLLLVYTSFLKDVERVRP